MHQLYLLVNAFGGSLKTLAKRLCGLSPSFFLYNNNKITKKLIIFSRHALKIQLPRYSIPMHEWAKKMKHHEYDNEFYQYTDLEMEQMDDLLSSTEYDTLKEDYITSLQEPISNWCYKG